MAVNIPKLSELIADNLSNLESELGVTIPLFGKNFLRAWATVLGGKQKLQYLYLANVQKNIFVDTADPEALGGTLERFGRVKLGRNPFSARAGSYDCTVTGLLIGAIIPAQTTYKSDDDSQNAGRIFILDADYTMVAGINTITLRALEGGLDSKLAIADGLTATAPFLNVNEEALVVTEVITPLAAETIEDYRLKTIEAFQLEPQGGASSDYRIWSADAQGVKRVYPYVKQGFNNEIEIYIEATTVDSTDGKGTPPASMVQEVRDVIEFDPDTTKPLNERGRRPLGIFNFDTNPINVREIDVVITGYVGLTPEIETIIFAAIELELSRTRPFIGGADVFADKNDITSVNRLISEVQEAVPSSNFTTLDLQVDTVSLPTFQFLLGDIPHLNSVTYV